VRKFIAALVCVGVLVMSISMTGAQTNTPTATPAGNTQASTSNVTIFFVACQDAVVMNLSGQMEAGYDVFYQVFSAAGATGTAITNLRQVSVDGAYAFSERLAYNSGSTVASGATASARVVIARETNAASTIYTTTVDDLQDGCNNPQNAVGTSLDAGAGAVSTTTSGQIRSPFGGFINTNIGQSPTPQPIVVIGARRDDTLRSDTPGVIFAECNMYLPQAEPGLLYDNDNITLFWSWFARTQEQVEQHILNAQYDVRFQTAPLTPVQVSPIQQIGTNFWVFYTTPIGRLTPGTYGVEFALTWKEAISDGYDDYGPGTDNVSQYSNCTFTIRPNPTGEQVTNTNNLYSLPR
jgi:hypothetical protein